VWHKLASDWRLYDFLLALDADLAAESFGSGACGLCGGRLHQAHYPRKPRGVPDVLEARRFSFCCGRDGCRDRVTPPSIRFLDRRVYLGIWVMLMAAITSGVNEQRRRRLWVELGVDERTITRWRSWWRSTLPTSPRWQSLRADVMPPPAVDELPGSVLRSFDLPTRTRAGPGAAIDVLRLLAKHPS
jgi:hypothetical protein